MICPPTANRQSKWSTAGGFASGLVARTGGLIATASHLLRGMIEGQSSLRAFSRSVWDCLQARREASIGISFKLPEMIKGFFDMIDHCKTSCRSRPPISLIILTLSTLLTLESFAVPASRGQDHQRYLAPVSVATERQELERFCQESLKQLPGDFAPRSTVRICERVHQLPECQSVQHQPIFHFDSHDHKKQGKRVLVMAVVHGDEKESGSIARRWMERLRDIDARNSWRIVPVLNPDGMDLKQRMNANGVDLNRNFPSTDWDQLAIKYWREKKNQDPRRYPGLSAASEPETRCAMAHIEDFKPDFIVAIHTPYGVLDFDGPRMNFPHFKWLPWVSLGTFPGSLGRYMWKDKQVPVLTVELKDDSLLEKIEEVDFLQDIAGTVAIKISSGETR